MLFQATLYCYRMPLFTIMYGNTYALITIIIVLLAFTNCCASNGKCHNSYDVDIIHNDHNYALVKSEMAALCGRWKLDNYKTLRDKWGGSYAGLICTSHHYFGKSADGMAWYQLSALEGPISLDPTSSPKKLDWKVCNEIIKGIYRLQENRLQIAIAPSTAQNRPSDFNYDSNDVIVYDLRRAQDKSVEYYAEKLHDEKYKWDGPCSNNHVLPRLHAARALAYIGDPAAPELLRALKNVQIDITSISEALSEIGLPVNEYWNEISVRDTTGIEKWWDENRERTAISRSIFRVSSGLPPVEGVNVFAISWWTEDSFKLLCIGGVIVFIGLIIIAWHLLGPKREL